MSKIVQLSEAVSLGLHSMILIARSPKLINVNKLAEATGASKNHLAKVLQRLVKANYLSSARGPTGGFILNKKPGEITILDIFESIEGKLDVDCCPLSRPICPFNECLVGTIVKKTSDEFVKYFSEKTLKDYL